MFTGIVEGMGRVASLQAAPTGMRLVVAAPEVIGNPALGGSVAVEGCCLTVTALGEGGLLSFDLVPATLSRTTLGDLRPGDPVNMERPLQLGSRIDGHMVQGHVDGVAVTERIEHGEDGGCLVTFRPEPAYLDLASGMIARGSVTVAGVALTIARLEPPCFAVALIPVTRELTTLGEALAVGRRVNVETDMMGKYVKTYLEQLGLSLPKPDTRARSTVDVDLLRRTGFLAGEADA